MRNNFNGFSDDGSAWVYYLNIMLLRGRGNEQYFKLRAGDCYAMQGVLQCIREFGARHHVFDIAVCVRVAVDNDHVT